MYLCSRKGLKHEKNKSNHETIILYFSGSYDGH